MTEADLEYLKSHIDQAVEIVTCGGDRLLIKVISVFDEDADSDVFLWDITGGQVEADSQQSQGQSLPLAEIVAVRPA